MLENAHKAIEKAGKKLGLSPAEIEELLEVEAAHEVELKLENGKKYSGFRMQHNSKRGPYKGGVRFHPKVDFDEVRALATLMSLKTALLDLPLGGGKGGVVVDPKELSVDELEELSRKYVRTLHKHIGPDKDIPAPDVNTNPQIMDWMADEYSKLTGDETLGSFTGKSLDNKGSHGRDKATGRGGLYVIEKLLELRRDSNKDLTYAVQGFGNAGAMFARLINEHYPSWKLVAVTDSSGGLYCEDGLDVERLAQYKKDKGKFSDFKEENVENIDGEEVLSKEVNVLVFAALGNVVDESNVDKIKAKFVLELANGPVSAEAAEKLDENGVVQIPDFLANAGGVVVSYFEWMQNINDEKWSEDKVNKKLRQHMRKATKDVFEMSKKEEISLKDAAFLLAVERLV